MALISRRRDGELESILEDVLVEGFSLVSRYKVPTLLGRERERGEIWQEIIEKYEEMGGIPSELRGKRVGGYLLLARFSLDKNPYETDETIIQPKAIK